MAEHTARYEVDGAALKNDDAFAHWIKVAVITALCRFRQEIPPTGRTVDYASIKIQCGYSLEYNTLRIEVTGKDYNGIFKIVEDGEQE